MRAYIFVKYSYPWERCWDRVRAEIASFVEAWSGSVDPEGPANRWRDSSSSRSLGLRIVTLKRGSRDVETAATMWMYANRGRGKRARARSNEKY